MNNNLTERNADRPIQVGDLVCVLRGCPDCGFRTGAYFSVTRIKHPIGFGYHCPKCSWCKVTSELGADGMEDGRIPLSWLKRIPPLSELEGERTEENLKEPA